MKNVMCRFFGHKRVRVAVVNSSDGRRFYSDPNGSRVACRRCRRVLPKTD